MDRHRRSRHSSRHPSRPRGVLHLALAGALLCGIAGGLGSPPAASAAPEPALAAANDDPGFIQVYDNNVENLPTVDLQCPGDWQDLVYYLTLQEYRPDVFLVQQISGQEQLDAYTARLSQEFGETYAGVIAEESPAAMNSPCGAPKDYQTNAVIYRADRFTLLSDPDSSSKRWQSQADEGAGCANNDQARTRNVKAMLHDTIADKDITVASIHWPTDASGGPPCAESNAREAAAEMLEDGYGGSLLVFGGDANYSDLDSEGAYRPWYAQLNGDVGGSLGYRDAVYSGCVSGGGAVADCLADNWTIGGSTDRRIDFLFASRGGGTLPEITGSHTVTFDEGDAADLEVTGTDREDRGYSDHRAVGARVHY